MRKKKRRKKVKMEKPKKVKKKVLQNHLQRSLKPEPIKLPEMQLMQLLLKK